MSQSDHEVDQCLTDPEPNTEPDSGISPEDDSPEVVVEDEDAIPPWNAELHGPEWRLWPPSGKMQIVFVVVAFGLFNCMLLGIWIVAVVKNN